MAGYVYVKDWKRFQHYGDKRRPPWIKLYLALLGDEEWLELSPSDTKLLTVIWLLAGSHGNGRVRADQGWLRAQAKTPKGNLEALIQAGFIEVRASKAASTEAEAEAEAEILLAGSREPKVDAAIKTINGEPTQQQAAWRANLVIREDGLGRLLVAIGNAADRGTEKTLQRIIDREHVSQHELERTREATLHANTTNRARYAVGTLQNLIKERSTA